MPKCLVTGASGFVGSRLCRYLVDSGWHVVAFVVPDAPLNQLHPIANRIQVEKVPAEAWAFIDLFEREKFDLVFHLASVFLSEHRPEHISQMIGANVTFGCHVLEAMTIAGCRYLVVTVIQGTSIDVILDIRRDSPTYGHHVEIELSRENRRSIYLEKGLAHGFGTLSDSAIAYYMVTAEYAPEHDTGIRYDSFGYRWPITNQTLSDRDLTLVPFDRFLTPF